MVLEKTKVARSVPEDDRLSRPPEIKRMTRSRRSTIYETKARGDFPDRYRVGAKVVIWLESEVRT